MRRAPNLAVAVDPFCPAGEVARETVLDLERNDDRPGAQASRTSGPAYRRVQGAHPPPRRTDPARPCPVGSGAISGSECAANQPKGPKKSARIKAAIERRRASASPV